MSGITVDCSRPYPKQLSFEENVTSFQFDPVESHNKTKFFLLVCEVLSVLWNLELGKDIICGSVAPGISDIRRTLRSSRSLSGFETPLCGRIAFMADSVSVRL